MNYLFITNFDDCILFYPMSILCYNISEDTYRVFIENCGKVMGKNTAVYQVI